MLQPVPGSDMRLMGLPLSFDGERPPLRHGPPEARRGHRRDRGARLMEIRFASGLPPAPAWAGDPPKPTPFSSLSCTDRRPAMSADDATDHHRRCPDDGTGRPRLSRDPRCGPRDLQELSRQLLAQARGRRRLRQRLRQGADRRRLPLRADPGGIRRLRHAAARRRRDPGGDLRLGRREPDLPRPDVHDEDAAVARQRRAEEEVPARHRQGRDPLPVVRRHRADVGLGHAEAQDAGGARRRPLRHQRPEDLDQPRQALRPDDAAVPDDAGRGAQEAHRRPLRASWSTSATPSARA